MNKLVRMETFMVSQVLKAILKSASFLIASLALISILLTAAIPVNALEDSLSPESNGDNPLGIVIERSDDSNISGIEKTTGEIKASKYPDLGDDQVFPFIAGLDSFE